MSYGFNLLNADGDVISDGVSMGYGLVSSGTVTTLVSGPALKSWTYGTGRPLLFLKVPSTVGWFVVEALSPTSFQISCYNSSNFRIATSVSYRVYTMFSALPEVAGFGMRQWDANGDVCFDSNYAIPDIAAIGLITAPFPTDTNPQPIAGTTIPAGVVTNPWVLANPFAVELDYAHKSSAPSTHLRPRFNTTSANNFQLSAIQVSGSGTSTDQWWTKQHQLLFMN